MPEPRPDFNWTPEAVEVLTKHWLTGLSCSQIASKIGNGVTRSAVVGKVHRLKLPKRAQDIGHTTSAQRADARAQSVHGNKGQPKVNAILARAVRKAPTPPPEPFDMEDGDGVDVTALVGIMENRGCKFIHGDPLGLHGYWGKPFKAGSKAWCDSHHEIVYLRSTR